MKVLVEMKHSYGATDIQHSKTIEMPCAPFYGMALFESDSLFENKIEFVNDDYTRTIIFFNQDVNAFEVSVREHWKKPVREDVVDSIIAIFKRFKWKRDDTNEIEYLKQLMRDNYERDKKFRA